MKSFTYMTAGSPESARAAVTPAGRYIAGGVDLLGEMKEYIAEPDVLVNVKRLPRSAGIEQRDGKWLIGTNATVAALAAHPELGAAFPGLAEAAGEVASPQIRNVATVGGNLAQHSRCWYYRHRDIECLKKGGSRCFARDGDSRYHALFTGNPCISPLVSNLATIFSVLDAQVVVQTEKGPETWSIAQLYERAWENPLAHNSLRTGDLILRVEIPAAPTRSAYVQVSEKSAFDWALVSCAAAARIDDGKLRQPRIALGVVSPIPHVSEKANAFLEGKLPDEATAKAAAEILLERADARPDNAYKLPMAAALIRRTLQKLVA
jgi:xanthine dehydrogenase YagS FAD-binding subunit